MRFTHCPKCGSGLEEQQLHDAPVPVCTNAECGFRFYQNSKPSVCVVLANTEGKILLVKRKIEPEIGKLDLPGGFLDEGEHPVEGALREIREELGLDIAIIGFLGFVPDRYLYQAIDYWVLNIGVVGTIITGAPKAADDIDGFGWHEPTSVTRDELAFENCAEFLRRYDALQRGTPVALMQV